MRVVKLFLKVWLNVAIGLLEGVMFFYGCALLWESDWRILGFSMLTTSLAAIITQGICFARREYE